MAEKKTYFGEIRINGVFNTKEKISATQKISLMEEGHVQAIHYPDCQQISIKLPEYYTKYSTISIEEKNKKTIIYQKNIGDVVSGSISVVIDSLFIPPGQYRILINTTVGLAHEIEFSKLKKGEKFPEKIIVIPEDDGQEKVPIVYRDGFGNIIKYEDDERWREVFY
jgi:hypothetical protein